MQLNEALLKVSGHQALSVSEMEIIMGDIMAGEFDENTLEKFLIALAQKGEAVSEITGAATVMRRMATTIQAPDNALDCCGTGGDQSGTYNISTAVALVSAACGVPVAKHGNRAASSKSGAADVLEAMGVNLSAPKEILEEGLRTLNFCFLMAPNHHAAMKHVVPIRKKIKQRTIFNLLGPLANPAGTKRQLLGVYDKKWVRPMAEVLHNLGTTSAWVVHGRDGLDEITTTTATDIAILAKGQIVEATITPADFKLKAADPKTLKGGDANDNAEALSRLLTGERSAYRDIVLANTAAVLQIQGLASSLTDGVNIAEDAIMDGAALQTLESYIELTQSAAA